MKREIKLSYQHAARRLKRLYKCGMGGEEEWNDDEMFSNPPLGSRSCVVNLNKTETVSEGVQGPVGPDNTAGVHLSVNDGASSRVGVIEQGDWVRGGPGHRLVGGVKVDSLTTQREGDFGAGEGGGWVRGGDHIDELWLIDDLEPEFLSVRATIGLEHEVHRIDLIVRIVPNLVVVDRADRKAGDEDGSTDVGGSEFRHGLVAPDVLQTPNTAGSETSGAGGESHVPAVYMDTGVHLTV